jgi:hypothetical protein
MDEKQTFEMEVLKERVYPPTEINRNITNMTINSIAVRASPTG